MSHSFIAYANLHNLLVAIPPGCVICWMEARVNDSPGHDAWVCPSIQESDYHILFRPLLALEPGFCCYFCTMPFNFPPFHPMPNPGLPLTDTNCVHGEIIKPLAYYIWITDLRESILTELAVSFDDMEEYVNWLGLINYGM